MIVVVDESILLTGNRCYVLAGVALEGKRKAIVRRAVRKIPVSGRRQFHWKGEEERERFAMIDVLVNEAASLFAYVQRPAPHRFHERGRAEMLGQLLGDLCRSGAVDLVIESRQSYRDQLDRQTIIQAQAAGTASNDLSYGHVIPAQEPLLWLADALAGAVMASTRKANQYISAFPRSRLTVRRMTPEKGREAGGRLMRP